MSDEMAEAQRRTIDSLQRLYVVVVALAIAECVRRFLVDTGTGALGMRLDLVPTFVALLVTIIPFYQGMNRHLDHAYHGDTPSRAKSGALLLDVVVFFALGIGFFALAVMLGEPKWFFRALMGVLGVDVAWGVLSHLIHGGVDSWRSSSSMCWSLINLIAIVALLVSEMSTLFASPAYASMVIAILRAIADYWISWSFYFPKSASSP